MSASSIISQALRLKRIQADRLGLTATRPKSLSRENARAVALLTQRRAPLFSDYIDDPEGFAEVELGLRLSRAQKRILRAISKGRRVAVRSAQKLGKSTSFVAAALWWAATRPRGRVLLTGPGNRQVNGVLWKELRRVVYDDKNLRADGKRVVDILDVHPAQLAGTGMQWPDGREIVGFSADSPDATQGFSGPEMLIIIDEGSGVDDDIFHAHEGNTAAGGRILAASNPTKNVGWFFDAFHDHAEFWEGIHLSAERDSPNINGEEPPIPGLADPSFLEEMKAKYLGQPGQAPHPEYVIRVLGDFATSTSNTIVGLAALSEAHRLYDAHADVERIEPLELGVDVARFGDDSTSIAPRRGRRIYPLVVVRGFDNNDVAGKVLEVVRSMRRPGEVPKVKIDCTGGHGVGPADILRAGHAKEIQVIEVNASSKADDEEKFSNLRAQLHFGVAEWLKDGGELPPDKQLDVELLAPTYSFDARRRYIVESKDKIKKRIHRSPDRADCVALAVYRGMGRGSGSSFGTFDFESAGVGGY